MIACDIRSGFQHLAWGGMLSLALFLGGCMDGGGGDASVGGASPSTLAGVAATGRPIVGATVTVKAGNGTQASATTDTHGAYAVALTTLGSPPYLIELAGGNVDSAANSAKYHSAALGAGTANITPISEMIVAAALAGKDSQAVASRFASFGASDAKLLSDALATAKTAVAAALAKLGIDLGSIDPLTVAFAADGSSDFDHLLGKLARGTLITPQPTFTAALDPVAFKASLEAASPGLTQVLGSPKCGVTVYYLMYDTIGGAGETTNASAAIMLPSGADAACSGPRPVVLYAHGTTVEKSFNMADLAHNQEAVVVAATYAAQGFIVVAPNYAGYDTSALSYHPYLNADQQAADMIDALRAARAALASVGASAASKLFLTGYSQGGFVAMATHKAMLSAAYAAEFKPTALGGMSGPYAPSLTFDSVFAGRPPLGGTIFAPMIVNSWQKSYGGLYASLSDIYENPWATGIDALIPGPYTFTTLVTAGKLPQLALFAGDSLPAAAPGFEAFFGSGNLIKTSYRNSYLADAAAHPCNDANGIPVFCVPGNPFRAAEVRNDLRSYTPATPVLLCGGKNDPTVFYPTNTQAVQAYFLAKGMPAAALTVVDVDAAPTGSTDPFAAAKLGFAQAKAAAAASGGSSAAGQALAVAAAYHGTLVPPFCNAVVQGYFKALAAS